MSAPDYLYDDDPQPLHAGRGRSRKGLLVALGVGTVAVAMGAAVVLPLFQGSGGEQAAEVVTVFTRAMAAGDTETSWGLLCEDEQARLQPAEVAGAYQLPGTATVGDPVEGELDGQLAEVVPVTWDDGGSVTTQQVTVIAQDGAKVCGLGT
jgi:hypothetical protein